MAKRQPATVLCAGVKYRHDQVLRLIHGVFLLKLYLSCSNILMSSSFGSQLQHVRVIPRRLSTSNWRAAVNP